MAKKEAAGDDVSKLPAFDQKSESLIPVLKGELPLKAHAHQANDIFTAIRIAKEFHTKLTLEHVTEGHLIVEELVKENLPLAVGPTFGHATKVELLNKSWTTPASCKSWLPCFNYFRCTCYPAAQPAPLCRHGHESRYGSLRCPAGHHHQCR